MCNSRGTFIIRMQIDGRIGFHDASVPVIESIHHASIEWRRDKSKQAISSIIKGVDFGRSPTNRRCKYLLPRAMCAYTMD
jgi:hypothetical protein